MNIRQEIALSLKCQIPVPEFRVHRLLTDEELLEIGQNPDYEPREDVYLSVSDYKVTQVYYFDGVLREPFISIDDPYLLTGRQGGKLDNNLVTMFHGEVNLPHETLTELADYLKNEHYKGFIALTFSIFDNGLFYNRISLSLPEDYCQNILNLYQLDEDTYITMLQSDTLHRPTGISCSCRLYSYPYERENNIQAVENTPIAGAYPLSYCYAISRHQEHFHIKEAWKALYDQLKDRTYTHNGICFNLDGGLRARKTFDILKRYGLITQ